MDIAVIYPRLERPGGAEKFGLELMKEWAKEHKITLYALSIEKRLLGEHGLDVETVTCKSSVPNWRTNTLALMAATKGMEKQLGKHDLYFTNLFPTHLIDRHPNVWYPHEPPRMLYDLEELTLRQMPPKKRAVSRLYFPLLRTLDRRLNHADRILANSNFCAEYLKKVYGRCDGVVYCGVRKGRKPEYGTGYALTVGRLSPEKRVDLAIKAVGQVSGMKLRIVGTGPQEEELKKMAGPNVEFLGQVPEAEMEGIYANALCTIYAPLREPYGRVPLDSLAAGTPVIAADEGGYTETLTDGTDSFLIEPAPENIAEKIRQLQKNPAQRREMGDAGWKKADKYTWEKTAKDILNAL